ncbi:MAG: hypothetical protein UX50_C0008G0001 [Candidatus Beckwithbacteria bacterium GW2011_GWA1_46_30]|nr:MAG: hypothetical protein UX50_C0008G0001 [Candidatus Beckwithbacteria bacterium GW2011_GWA1_46_30]OFZ71566.1 MAG: hypothetical protein A3K03_04340 [Bdellovibrionales bacterium RIFOXYD1_FULL_44_7]
MVMINKAIAKCHDCQQAIEGELDIGVMAVSAYFVGTTRGGLVLACGKHHDKNRKWGEDRENIPQHDEFDIFVSDEQIGTMSGVSSMGAEAWISMGENEFSKKLNDEVRAFSEEHRRRWRY